MRTAAKLRTSAFRFSRWTNKKYAVFNSIRKQISIGVLSVCYTIILAANNASGKDDSIHINRVYETDEVLIEADQSLILPSQEKIVTILTAHELKSLPSRSLQDVLDYSGLDIRQRAPGAQADISVRGGTFDQVIVLLNGINFTDPQTGHYALNLPVDVKDIRRIEILRSAEAGLHTGAGYTAIINIITTGPLNDSTFTADFSAGSYSWYKGYGRLYLRNKKNVHTLSTSLSGHNGYRYNTGLKTIHGYYTAGFYGRQTSLQIQAGYMDKSTGANGFYSARYPDQYDENTTGLFSIQGAAGKKIMIKPAAYFRRHYDHYTLIRHNPGAYQNYHRTDVAGSGLMTHYSLKHFRTTLGADYRYENILSNNLGYEVDPHPVKSADSSYHRGYNRKIITFSATQTLKTKYFQFIAGLNTASINTLKNIGYYPLLELTVPAFSWLSVYTGWRKTYRQPTFTDLFYKSRIQSGNPYLEPEISSTVEGGLKGIIKNFDYSASYFIREGKNTIDWYWDSFTKKWKATNILSLRTEGVEIQTGYKLKNNGQRIYPEFIQTQYTFLNQHTGTLHQSLYALDYLTHKWSAGINLRIYRHFGLGTVALYSRRHGTYLAYDPATKTESEKSFSPVFTLNSRFYVHLQRITGYIETDNLMDVQYYDIGNLPQPGRWLRFGITFSTKNQARYR